MPGQVSAVILAAGMSARIGAPKQLLRIGGRPVLQHAVDSVRRSNVSGIVLVLGAAAEQIQAEIPLDGVRVAINRGYAEGMAGSIRTGLLNLDPAADAAVMMLGDQPFVQPRTINQLIAAWRERSPRIALPVYKGARGNPALLDRAVFPDALQLQGDAGFRTIFGRYAEQILSVPVDDPGILADLDTAADLERCRQFFSTG